MQNTSGILALAAVLLGTCVSIANGYETMRLMIAEPGEQAPPKALHADNEPLFRLLKADPRTPAYDGTLSLRPPTNMRGIGGPLAGTASGLDALGNVFDVQEMERPWSVTTSVHVQAKTDEGIGRLVPFASVAKEVATADEQERIGFGGGAAYFVTKSASFGTELLYFGSRSDSNDAFEKESRLMFQFQWTF